MKTRNILALAVFSLLGFTACSSDDENLGADGKTMEFNVSIASPTRTNPQATDASVLAFDAGDQIEVNVDDNSQSCVLTYDGTNWKADKNLKWTSPEMTLKAMTCYGEVLQLDQSTLENIKQSDLMTFGGQVKASDGVVNIQMERQTARIRLSINIMDDLKDLNPKVEDLKVYGSQFSMDGTVREFTPYFDGSVYTVLSLSLGARPDETFVKMKVSTTEGVKDYIVKGIPELIEGMSYNFHLNLGKQGVTIGDVTIAPWIEKTTEDLGTEDGKLYTVDKTKNLVELLNPGELTAEAVTEAMNVTDKLAISGPMNSTDFKVLRTYMGGPSDDNSDSSESKVKELDLSGVNVVKGGESYYTDGYGNQISITEDNSLGQYVFNNINHGPNGSNYAIIRKIILPNTLTAIGPKAFDQCGVEEIVLPEGLVTISDDAFSRTSINTVKIPSSVRTVGQTVFCDCKNLTRVEIPEGVESIGYGAFMRNLKLEYVSLPSTIKSLSSNFQGCSALKTLEFKVKPTAGVSNFNFTEQDAVNCELFLNKAWKGNEKLNLPNNTFNGTKFKSITLINEDGSLYGLSIDKTKNLVTILEAGFLHPNAITEAMNGTDKLAISGPMNSTDFKVLRICMGGPSDDNSDLSESKVKELDLSGVNVVKGGESYHTDGYGNQISITEDNSLGQYVFTNINYSRRNYESIRKITLPNTLTAIEENAFINCGVEEIVLPEGLVTISDAAFSGTLINTVKIPSSVRTVGQTVFCDCKNLTRVEIPEGVESIGYGAFTRNAKLEYVSLPSTIKFLHENFQGCPALKTLEFKVQPTAKVNNFTFAEQDAVNCELLLNKAWEGNAKLDMQNNTFNGTKFKSIRYIQDDTLPVFINKHSKK